MIQHIGEVLAVLTTAFVVGSIVGWIVYRLVDRTDYAFDQRDLADAVGRLFGIRTPPPVEEPAVAGLAMAAVPAVVTRFAPPPAVPRSEPVRRLESPPRSEPVALPDEVADWLRLEPAGKSEAAEDLRKRVQSSSRALAWREARDERLRPGEAAADAVAAADSPPQPAAAELEREMANDKAGAEPAPSPAVAVTETPRQRNTDEPVDQDEPWAAAPEVWPVDLRRLPAPDGGSASLALPAPLPSEIRLAFAPVSRQPLAADDIWSDDDDAPRQDAGTAPTPPAADRPPALAETPKDRDNLRRIKGIGQGFEKRLNQLGIYRYDQIAAWTENQQAWVSAELGFPGRVERDDWPMQASRLGRSAEARAASEPEIVRDP